MKLSTRYDLDLAASEIFADFCDTKRWERAAILRGASVRRSDQGSTAAEGATWQIVTPIKGKPRDITLTLTKLRHPELLIFNSTAKLLSGEGTIHLTALSPDRTRVSFGLEVTPNTLPARLMLQSARLAKSRIEKRFTARVRAILAEIGERLKPQ